MAQQIYRPLNKDAEEIRLMTLLPSPTFSAPIVCTLKVMSLNGDDIFYKALSYTWGDPNNTAPITLNGVEHHITVNLASALRHIRDQSDEVVLWVDAICIHQSDSSERNHQVQLMRDIYSGADSVTVWLGEEQDDSDISMDLMKRWSTSETHNVGDASSALSGVPDLPHGRAWPAVKKLFERSWWTRIWVIQEVVFAREVHFKCGYQELSWDEFSNGFEILADRRHLVVGDQSSPLNSFARTLRAPATIIFHREYKRPEVSQGFHSSDEYSSNEYSSHEDSSHTVPGNKNIFINSHAENWDNVKNCIDENCIGEDSSDQDSSSKDTSDIVHGNRISSVNSDKETSDGDDLLGLMTYFSFFNATDPRDKIYALFGLSTDAEDFGVPDYLKPVDELYYEVALTSIRRDRSLRVLCCAGTSIARGGQMLDLPSWVPNWTSMSNPYLSPAFSFHAASDRKADFRFSDDCKTLHACGIICDKILSLESIHSVEVAQEEPLWKSFLSNYEQQVYRTGITQLQALFRTLMFDSKSITPDRLKVGSQGFFDDVAGFLYELGLSFRPDPQQEHLQQVPLGKDPDYITNFLQWKGESRNGRSDRIILEPFLGKADSDSFVEWPVEGDLERGSKCYQDYSIHRRRMSHFSELFRTDQGFMGIAMPGAEKGDLICVLFGCDVPLILREIKSRYSLVGPCFVLGLMDGEAIQDFEDGKVSLYEFGIS